MTIPRTFLVNSDLSKALFIWSINLKQMDFPCRSVDMQPGRLGIRGTQVKSSIQDIVDEVAPIKKAPYGVEGRFIRM